MPCILGASWFGQGHRQGQLSPRKVIRWSRSTPMIGPRHLMRDAGRIGPISDGELTRGVEGPSTADLFLERGHYSWEVAPVSVQIGVVSRKPSVRFQSSVLR